MCLCVHASMCMHVHACVYEFMCVHTCVYMVCSLRKPFNSTMEKEKKTSYTELVCLFINWIDHFSVS